MTVGWHTTGHKQDPILVVHRKASSAEQKAWLSQLWLCCEDLGRGLLHPASWSMYFYSTLPTLASVKSWTREEKGPGTWKWTDSTTWPDHPDGLCVCVPTMWTTAKLELKSNLGPGLTCKYGCRHLVFSQPLSYCESSQTKAKLIPASASTTWGMDRMSPSVTSPAFCGVGRAQLSPTLRFGGASSPLVSQQLPGFLFIMNLMGEWQQSSSGFSNELRGACSWEFESLANSPQ